MFSELLDTIRETKIMIFIPATISLIVAIIEYVKMAKGTSCLWWLNKAKQAEQEGRTLTAHLEHSKYYGITRDRHYTRARYKYQINGETRYKTIRYQGFGPAAETVRLYYDKNPNFAKTYEQYTHDILRHCWPWIMVCAIMVPSTLILVWLNLL